MRPAPERDSAADAGARRVVRATRRSPELWLLVGAYALLIARVYLSTLARGLWEDGYFAKRFAYNFWHHGSFSWNPADGPSYGMTSQVLELSAALLYRLAPEHFVLTLKAALFAALPLTLGVLLHLTRPRDGAARARGIAGFPGALVCLAGLAEPLLPEIATSGLETPLALLGVALTLVLFRRFTGGHGGRALGIACLGLYLTRPDAILIPLVLLSGHALLSTLRPAPRVQPGFREALWVLAGVGLGLGVLLAGLRAYYGSALPLPFYVKVRGLSVQDADHLAIFAPEKLENLSRFAFCAAPLVFIALHARSREVGLWLSAAAVFTAYHALFTIETMGQLSRFYLPALVPLVAAAAQAYPAYLQRRRLPASALFAVACLVVFFGVLGRRGLELGLPREAYAPALVVLALLLVVPPRAVRAAFWPALLVLVAGAFRVYPVETLDFADDERILLDQIRRRMAFREIERVRERLHPRVLFHTDMGAPGVLFPEARVVDIDGLLNPAIALRHMSVEELCRRERPDVFYVPNAAYPSLRAAILGGRCIQDYRRVVPLDRFTTLHVRSDLLPLYGALDPEL